MGSIKLKQAAAQPAPALTQQRQNWYKEMTEVRADLGVQPVSESRDFKYSLYYAPTWAAICGRTASRDTVVENKVLTVA